MAIKCGWASQDENKHARGGKAGDQTGWEVKTGPWYSFGQNVIIRCKDRKKAHKMANAMKWLCETNYIGYDQGQRTTAFTAIKNLGWANYKKLRTLTETDCSNLITICANIAGYNISPNCWTGNLKAALVATGDFQVLTASKYLTGGDYLLKGDIILNEKAHVIMALESGSKGYLAFPQYTVQQEINLRKGAGTKYDVICKVPKGKKIYAKKFGDYGWGYAHYNGHYGFVRLKSSKKTYCKKI